MGVSFERTDEQGKSSPLAWMREELDRLGGQSQLRTLSSASVEAGGWLVREGRRMLNLASNHYLGLDLDLEAGRLERIATEAAAAGSGARLGATASRLIAGSDPVYERFEQEFARFKGTESCLLFGSGYTCNLGVISSLAGRNDVVFSDRLNHASITDGIVLSRAEHARYRHRDMNHLESLLKKTGPGKRKLIVSDSVFSMDGTLAPLRELVELKERYGAMLMLDEAHGGGIFGPHGEGLAHEFGVARRVDIHMGTFSKSYGGYGAYAAGESVLKEFLVNKARSLIYTTALPPLVVWGVRDNWQQARAEAWRRETLLRQSAWFRDELRARGFDTGETVCQIVPLIAGDNARTVELSRLLQQEGIAAVAIRPPTVPEGSARIRFTLMATHRREDLEYALDRIEAAGKMLGIV